MKRIASIQDLSCIGKCSQGIALPVLSAMGMECAALPTALLSAHTAFPGFVSYDLTSMFSPMIEHWRKLNLKFDAIYTGYLGSEEQIALVGDFFRDFADGTTLRFVDPVMADHGKLYAGFSDSFPEAMRQLCSRADVLTPNVTEACLLTGLEYRERHDEPYIRRLLEALLSCGVKLAVLTGLRTDETHAGAAAMTQDGAYRLYRTDYIPEVFHGTGDLFASVCVGALTLGRAPFDAVGLAVDEVMRALRATMRDPSRRWYGVNFEETLPALISAFSDNTTPKEVTL